MAWVMQYKPIGEDSWFTDIDEYGNDELWHDKDGAEQTARDRTKYRVYNAKWRVVEADGSL